jgi:hypothetical protein
MIACSKNKNPDCSNFNDFGFGNSVSAYLDRDRSKYRSQLLELQYALYSYLSLAGTEFDPTQDLHIKSGLTDDLSTLFYSFDDVMNCTNEQFYNGWQFSSDLTTGIKVTGNTLISLWALDLENKGTEQIEVDNIQNLINWLDDACSDASAIMLWEDLGKTVKQPNTKDIATDVFMNRKLKKCVDDLRLPVHVPSYLV